MLRVRKEGRSGTAEECVVVWAQEQCTVIVNRGRGQKGFSIAAVTICGWWDEEVRRS